MWFEGAGFAFVSSTHCSRGLAVPNFILILVHSADHRENASGRFASRL